jgi:type II secretory pathway pseudopilin PulG
MMRKYTENGFTFVEMAIVMIISGLIFLGLTKAFTLYNIRQAQEHTLEALQTSQDALGEYVARQNAYPCPSSPLSVPGDADFGVANCNGAGVAKAAGRNGMDVYIGAIPLDTMFPVLQDVRISRSDTVDGWGNQLTYAVTGILTDPLTYNEKEGAIYIVDEFGNTVLEESGHAHAVVVSHGEDGIGAYTAEGAQTAGCSTITLPGPPATPTSATINEIENCDSDGQFLSGLRILDENLYNDDIVNFMINKVYNLWEYLPGVAPSGANMVRNTNPGDVGIGVEDPTQKLHIAGDLKAQIVRADYLCDKDGVNCMPVDKLAGAGMTECSGPNQVAWKIAGNKMLCKSIFSGTVTGSCATGEAAVGIRSDGTLICEVP